MKLAWMRSTGLPAPEQRENWSTEFQNSVSESVWSQGFTAYNTFTMQQVQELYFYLYTIGLTLPTVSVDFDYSWTFGAQSATHSVTLSYTPPVGADTITYSKTLNARIAPSILDHFPFNSPPDSFVGNALIEPDFEASGFPIRTDDLDIQTDIFPYDSGSRNFYSRLQVSLEIFGNIYFSYIGVNPATNQPMWTLSSQPPFQDVDIAIGILDPFADFDVTVIANADSNGTPVPPQTGGYRQKYFIPCAGYDVDSLIAGPANASIETVVLGSVSVTFLKLTTLDSLDYSDSSTGAFGTFTADHTGVATGWGINSHTLNPPVS